MRLKKLQNEMIKKNIDIVLIFSLNEIFDKNLYYYTNFKGIGVLCVLKDNYFLITPEMEYEKAKKSFNKVYKAEKKKRLLETLVFLLNNKKIKKNENEKIIIGIDMYNINVFLFKKIIKYFKRFEKIRVLDVNNLFNEIRIIKEEKEIEYIKKACSVSDLVYKKICNNFNFKTENDLKKFIELEIKKNNCELAFDPIVASSKNSSMPHYNIEKNKKVKIKKGFLLLDFGAKYNDYCSDMTRMLYIGKPNNKEIEDYKLVLKTIKECESFILKNKNFSNINTSKIYKKAIEILKDKAKYFTHSLGHGLGLDIHETPSLSEEDKTKLKENIVFTIEPGIYFNNKYGIRIEDTLVIKKNKLEILTKSSKELKIVNL